MSRIDDVRTRRRVKGVNFRLSQEDYDELEFMAENAGIKTNDFIRKVLTDFIHHRQ